MSINSDQWVPGGRAEYLVDLKREGDGTPNGSFKGTFRGKKLAGKATAEGIKPPKPPKDFVPFKPRCDVTLVGVSYGTADALMAAQMLAQDGVEAEVIDLRWLRPLDIAPVVESVARTGRLVVVDTGHVAYGLSLIHI